MTQFNKDIFIGLTDYKDIYKVYVDYKDNRLPNLMEQQHWYIQDKTLLEPVILFNSNNIDNQGNLIVLPHTVYNLKRALQICMEIELGGYSRFALYYIEYIRSLQKNNSISSIQYILV